MHAKEAKEKLKKAGLALGMTEALMLAGCVEQNEKEWADANTGWRDSASEQVPGIVIPLRIDRGFFENSVVADLSVTAADGARLEELRSEVSFEEGRPTGPAPTEPYVADFRDRPGYARLESAEGVALKFNVVPDVSSLDVTAEKVSLEGIEPLIEQRLREAPVAGCAPRIERVEFSDAHKEDGGLFVRFRAQPAAAEAGQPCAPLNVTLRLSG